MSFDSPSGGRVQEVVALTQGCSLSPILEAVTLAWHARKTSHSQHRRLELALHDDYHTVITAEFTGRLALPDTRQVGGEYKQSKTLCVGPHPAADGIGSRVPHAKFFGRPVGNTAQWVQQFWVPKITNRLRNIARLNDFAPNLAIATAHRIKGLGMARHWLRGVPPGLLQETSFLPIRTALRNLDEDWSKLIQELAGSKTPPDWNKLYTTQGIAHIAATDIMHRAAITGMLKAFTTVKAVAEHAKIWDSAWLPWMGIPQNTNDANHLTVLKELLLEQPADQVNEINLWVAALNPPSQLKAVVDVGITEPGTKI